MSATKIEEQTITRSEMRILLTKSSSFTVVVRILKTLVDGLLIKIVWFVLQLKPPVGRSSQYDGAVHRYAYC